MIVIAGRHGSSLWRAVVGRPVETPRLAGHRMLARWRGDDRLRSEEDTDHQRVVVDSGKPDITQSFRTWRGSAR